MAFPEILSLLKRFAPNSAPIELGLKNIQFNASAIPEARWLYENGYFGTLAALGAGAPSWSGESVNVTTALMHSAVWACNRIISESVGLIPAVLMQETSSGKRKAEEHPAFELMKHEPNPEISAKSFRETLTSHCLLTGNGYARIIRRSGTGVAIGFELLQPAQVNPTRDKAGRLVYEIRNQDGTIGATYTVLPGKPQDILHIRGLGWDGLRGHDVISYARNSIGNMQAQEKNVGSFWAQGARTPGHIEWDQYYSSDPARKLFIDSLREILADPHKTYLLERGQKFVKDGMTMVDAQSLEGRVFAVSEACRWFDVSPPLIHDLSRATFDNVEKLFQSFEKLTLSKWLRTWEGDFRRCVLTPAEKAAKFYLYHNVNALLKADFQPRMDGYSKALQNGWLTIDEVRDLEDRDPLPEGAGSHSHIQSNMGLIMRDGQVQTPQPAATPTPGV